MLKGNRIHRRRIAVWAAVVCGAVLCVAMQPQQIPGENTYQLGCSPEGGLWFEQHDCAPAQFSRPHRHERARCVAPTNDGTCVD